MIIASNLDEMKKKLLEMLQNHNGAIAWKICYIRGISPTFCIHKILTEDNFKPVV